MTCTPSARNAQGAPCGAPTEAASDAPSPEALLRIERGGRVFCTLLEMIEVAANMPGEVTDEQLALVLSAAALLDIPAKDACALILGPTWAAESLEDERQRLLRLVVIHHEKEQRLREARAAYRVLRGGFDAWLAQQQDGA